MRKLVVVLFSVVLLISGEAFALDVSDVGTGEISCSDERVQEGDRCRMDKVALDKLRAKPNTSVRVKKQKNKKRDEPRRGGVGIEL